MSKVVPWAAAQSRVDDQIKASPLKEPSWSRVIDSHECNARLLDAPPRSRVEVPFDYGRIEP